MHETGIRVFARIGRVQTLLVGQNDERIGFHQIGDQRAQRVVVAKLDLVIDDSIVFIDNGHDAQLQQGQQGRAGVQVALTVGQVGMGQQHLRAADAVFAQLGFIHLHQAHLADGSGCLQFMDGLGACVPAQALHAFGNRAAADHDDFTPVLDQGSQLLRPLADGLGIQAAAFVGHQTRPDLDHNAPGVAQNRRA